MISVEPFTNLITLTLTAGGEEQSAVGTVRQGQPFVSARQAHHLGPVGVILYSGAMLINP